MRIWYDDRGAISKDPTSPALVRLLRLSLNDLAQTTGVENDLGDELVHDPTLVELLWGVVLFDVE